MGNRIEHHWMGASLFKPKYHTKIRYNRIAGFRDQQKKNHLTTGLNSYCTSSDCHRINKTCDIDTSKHICIA